MSDRSGTTRHHVQAPKVGALFDRLPPHSVMNEMCLLGSMILDPRVIEDVVTLIPSSAVFYDEKNGAIYEALVAAGEFHRTGNLVVLSTILHDKGLLDDIGGDAYLLELAQGVPSSATWNVHAKIVREKYLLRRAIEACGEGLYDAYRAEGDEPASAVVDRIESLVYSVGDEARGGESSGPVSTEVLMERALDDADARHQGKISERGLKTGFYDLDDITSGLQPGEMIIIGARPSMGKSALMLDLAVGCALSSGITYGIISLEMSAKSLVDRMLCAHASVDSHRLRRGLLESDDFKRLAHAAGVLSPLGVVDDTPGQSINQVRSTARRMVSRMGCSIILVDYLQLMSSPGAYRAPESRQVEVSSMSRSIKSLARELNVPVVCLCQLNRQNEQREGNRPRMSDLRESGSIEQDADVVMLLHREEYYHQGDQAWTNENPDKVGVAELIVAKQRNGPTGIVQLAWDARSTTFRNLAKGVGR